MSIEIETGGPAFPYPGIFNPYDNDVGQWQGMKLRDYFAAAAIAALIHTNPRYSTNKNAQTAYRIADAMLHVKLTSEKCMK